MLHFLLVVFLFSCFLAMLVGLVLRFVLFMFYILYLDAATTQLNGLHCLGHWFAINGKHRFVQLIIG